MEMLESINTFLYAGPHLGLKSMRVLRVYGVSQGGCVAPKFFCKQFSPTQPPTRSTKKYPQVGTVYIQTNIAGPLSISQTIPQMISRQYLAILGSITDQGATFSPISTIVCKHGYKHNKRTLCSLCYEIAYIA